ncbi:MAG: alanine--tRNA ligase [Candidatus Omnitrophota bacterium]
MKSYEIRKRFLEFFKQKGHTIVESDLLVPKDDPTLLFTGAGMNQFKEQFMGKNIVFTRAASCQKCLRTGDLENVGKTPRHHTFFEMLGNFSFGDYFKKEAIFLAWEFMTKEMKIPEHRLWVSVYKDDEESYSIWRDDVKVPVKRIVKLGAKDNFWPADAPAKGPNGPCGPCSEIFYDWGENTGCGKEDCNPACDCGRFVEVWNLVFTEFERKPDGGLIPLPNKNIDTGMGLERMASVMQNVKTNFETDLFQPMLDDIVKEFKKNGDTVSFENVCLIADHIRAAVFAIVEGVSPSNEKRGYVVRKLIRRSYLRSPRKGPFLYNLVPKVVSLMKEIYPEIYDSREHISAIIKEEEERFSETLNSVLPMFRDMIEQGKGRLDGKSIFKLVDTYGLPLDVIKEEAEREKIALDIEEFEKLMCRRKEESRKGSDIACEFIFKPDQFAEAPNPEYSDKLPLEARIEFILKEDKISDEICEGECAEIVTSPQSGNFYSESGGQVGDTGVITKPGAVMNIMNTFETNGRKIFGVIAVKGSFKKNEKIEISLNSEKKQNTAKNHTATHLLQAALRNVLGEHIKQSGSYVDDKRLRFDFTHMKKLTERELTKIEYMVNSWIEEAVPVSKKSKALKDARDEGALSFFGEKYGDIVRVVTIGDKSKELCGGTHVDNIKDIGIIKIVSESSVASGIRRIEALTDVNAEHWIKEKLRTYHSKVGFKDAFVNSQFDIALYSYALKIMEENIKIDKDVVRDFEEKIIPVFKNAVEDLEKAAKKKQKEKESDGLNDAIKTADLIVKTSVKFGRIEFFSGIIENIGMQVLRKTISYLERKLSPDQNTEKIVVVLFGATDNDQAFLIGTSSNPTVNAAEMIKKAAEHIDGKGGGKPVFAQAGGSNPAGLQNALKTAAEFLRETGGKV